jgi:hypothetical protein
MLQHYCVYVRVFTLAKADLGRESCSEVDGGEHGHTVFDLSQSKQQRWRVCK